MYDEYEYRTIETTYGNGQKHTYTRALPIGSDNPRPYPIKDEMSSEEYEKEKERVRNINARKRWLAISNSENLIYTTTFTTTIRELAQNGALLLKTVRKYLKKKYPNIKCVGILECFDDENKGFHVHVLSDIWIDLRDWADIYGDMSNLYSDEMKKDQIDNSEYDDKKIAETKRRLPRGTRIYFSINIKRKEPERTIYAVDKDGNKRIVYENDTAYHKRIEKENLYRQYCKTVKENQIKIYRYMLLHGVLSSVYTVYPVRFSHGALSSVHTVRFCHDTPCINVLFCKKRYIWEEERKKRHKKSRIQDYTGNPMPLFIAILNKINAQKSDTGLHASLIPFSKRLFVLMLSKTMRYIVYIEHIPDG